jgi:hypothetical protein
VDLDEIPLIGVARAAYVLYRLDTDYKWQPWSNVWIEYRIARDLTGKVLGVEKVLKGRGPVPPSGPGSLVDVRVG